jgi:phytoene dehydrogenase-like protein
MKNLNLDSCDSSPPAAKLQPSYDVVVVGSGHNGLVAAAYLATAGKSVLVLEQARSFGGATTSQRVFPDFDAMLSRYSYLVALFPRRILEELRLGFETRRRRIASFTPWTDARGRPRGLVLSNVDEQRSRDSMRDMTGSDTAWQRYQELLALEHAIAKIAWPSLLEPLQSRASFQSRLRTSEERAAWRAFVEQPLGEVLEAHADHDALRGLLLTDGKIGVFADAHDASLLQNRCFLYHVIGNETGEWRVPVGGMRSLADALVDRCRSLGVTLAAESPAVRIETGPERHHVWFESEGHERSVAATHVLVNAAPKTFARLLDEPWQPHAEDEGSVVKINMLLKRLPRLKADGISPEDAFAGSFHIDEGYAQLATSFAAARDGRLPDPAPGEIYCHTLTDDSILSPELRARGYHTLTLFGLDMPWRLFAAENNAARREEVARLYLAGLNRLCAEPIEECLARDAEGRPCIEVKTPRDLEAEIGLDQGNIFHNALSWFFTDDESVVGTWGVETHHPRILRAGSSALRGGAVSGIPGRNAAMCVLQE